MIVVATKLDATTDRQHLEELRAFAKKRGLEFHAVSSASGEGIVELVRAMADALDRIPKPALPVEPEAPIAPSRERDEEEASAAAHDDDSTSASGAKS
jgi:GTP-binding protein